MEPDRTPTPAPERAVVIVGAGHQGRNVLDILAGRGTAVAGFLDDTRTRGEDVNGARVLGGFARTEDGDLLRQAASIVVLGEAAFVGPGAQVTAGAALGEGAHVGAKSIVVGPARVGAHTIVGAGAVVRGDLPERVLAVGAPCRIVRPLSAADAPFFAQPRSTGNSVPLT